MNRPLLRAAVLGAAATLAVVGTAVAASAHVKVYSYTTAVQGGDAALVFRVPSEEDSPTVSLTVSLPTATPIPSISVENKPGWTITVTNRSLASPVQTDDGPVTQVVSTVTWKAAAGQGIPAGQYEEFDLSAEGLPKVASLAFPSVQTYANGDVVRWIEPTPAGGQEPDHPVPVLDLQPASASGTDASSTGTSSGDTLLTEPISVHDSTARDLGIAGIVVGAVGIVAAGAAFATRRRRA